MVSKISRISLIQGFTRAFIHVVLGLVTGLTFFKLGDTALDLLNRIFAIFQATVLPALVMSQVESRYEMSRFIFFRESGSKAYSQWAFVISVVVAEIPYGIIAAVLVYYLLVWHCSHQYFVCFYFPAGFKLDYDRMGYQFLIILIDEVSFMTEVALTTVFLHNIGACRRCLDSQCIYCKPF